MDRQNTVMQATINFKLGGRPIWFEVDVPDKLAEAIRASGPIDHTEIVFRDKHIIFTPGIKN